MDEVDASPNKKSEKIDSYSLESVSNQTDRMDYRIRTPIKMDARPITIALLSLTSLLVAVKLSDYC
jgi:hypothetical protein